MSAEAQTVRRAFLPAWLVRAFPVLRIVGFVAAVGVVVVMGVVALRDLPDRELDWYLLGPSVLAAGAWWLLLGRGWGLLASGRAGLSDVSLWCRTQTLRYLPGGFWAPASRVAATEGGHLDRITTVAAENVIALCAALTVGGAALAVSGRWIWLPLVLVVAAPLVAARFTAARTRVGPERTLKATGNYLLAFVAYVVCAMLVQAALTGWQDPLGVAGAAAIAWAAGLVVVFAPGGIGIREVVYVALLSSSFAESDLSAAALTMRAVTIVAELVVLVAAGRPTPAATPVD